jgi:hypothetical protein
MAAVYHPRKARRAPAEGTHLSQPPDALRVLYSPNASGGGATVHYQRSSNAWAPAAKPTVTPPVQGPQAR